MVEEHRLFNASDLLRLNDLAKSENIQVVSKIISSWSDSKAFFGDRGEGLWIARTTESGEVIGVGGITICPTLPGCRRVRRFCTQEESDSFGQPVHRACEICWHIDRDMSCRGVHYGAKVLGVNRF